MSLSTHPIRRTTASRFAIRPFEAPLGAEVVGLDLARPVEVDRLEQLRAALRTFHVLVFRDQGHLDPADQVAFSALWGRLQRHVLRDFALSGHPEVLVVSNVRRDGRPIGLGDAGAFWHSDLSYKARPSLGSLLLARQLPQVGGDTLFADQHAAWREAARSLRALLERRTAEHSYLKEYEALRAISPWRPALTPEQVAEVPPVWHPAVRTHPESGSRALFVNEHFTTRLADLPEDESEAVLVETFAHQTRDE
ncbi:MAG: TauD/TfdA family dioxygenase, partial [Burkholderiales bacterium]